MRSQAPRIQTTFLKWVTNGLKVLLIDSLVSLSILCSLRAALKENYVLLTRVSQGIMHACTSTHTHARTCIEHKKNLQSDCWRIAQVEKTLSNPKHPWRHFETGNLETLMDAPKRRGQDVRQELLKFHETFYSANIMKLCVLGKGRLE